MQKTFKYSVLFSIGVMSLLAVSLAHGVEPENYQPALLTGIDAEILSKRSMDEVRGESKYIMAALDSVSIWVISRLISFNTWDADILKTDNKLPAGVGKVGNIKAPGIEAKVVELLSLFSWRYGNWGGKGWSNNGSKSSKLVAGVDSMDECFKKHDLAYAEIAAIAVERAAKARAQANSQGTRTYYPEFETPTAELYRAADLTLLSSLNTLPNTPTFWGISYSSNSNVRKEPIPTRNVQVYLNQPKDKYRSMIFSDYARRQAVLAFRYKTK